MIDSDWVGTDAGQANINGYRWSSYPSPKGNSTASTDSRCDCMQGAKERRRIRAKYRLSRILGAPGPSPGPSHRESLENQPRRVECSPTTTENAGEPKYRGS